MLSLAAPGSHAIVSGSYVINPNSDAPWAVSIWVQESAGGDARFICSATLIEPQIILTAAHCFQGIKGSFFVEVDATTLDSGKFIEVDSFWISPRYNKSRIVNDVGVGHLITPHNLKTYPRLDTSSKTGNSRRTPATIYGWGADQNGEITGDLRKTVVTFQNSSAQRSYGGGFNAKTNLAAGKYIAKERIYTAACSGDSGGPLISGSANSPVIVGIVSYGPAESCNRSLPTVFSRVYYYLNDIATAKKYVTSRARTSSLAAPVVLEEPKITGAARLGQKLICSDGVWTPNKKSVTKTWFAVEKGAKNYDGATKIGTGDSLELTREMFSKELLCNVTATAQRKSRDEIATFTLPDLEASASIVEPTAGSKISGRFTLKAQAETSSAGDTSVSKVCLKINGKVPSTGSFLGSYSFGNYADSEGCFSSQSDNPSWDFDTTNWDNGNYSFEFYFVDTKKNKSTLATSSFVVSNSEPTSSFISPADGSVLKGRFTLKGSAKPASSGTSSIQKVCLKLNDRVPTTGWFQGSYSFSNYADSEGCFDSSSTDPSWEFDATKWTNGTYVFSMYAEDSSKRKSSVVSRKFTISNDNPTANFLTPTEGAVIAGRFTLKGQAVPSSTGTASISKICLKMNNSTPSAGWFQGSYSFSNYADSEGCFDSSSTDPAWEFDATPWSNGTYLFTYYAVDTSGRTSNTVNRTITVNNGIPQIAFVTPASGTRVNGRFTVTATATPAQPGTASMSKHCLKLNGAAPTSGWFQGSYSFSNYADGEGCFTSSTTSPSWEFNTSDLGPGTYSFTYFATDSNNRSSQVSSLQIFN